MPMKKMGSREACISYNYKEMVRSGHPSNQAQAAALNFCNSQWGGIPKKKNKAHEMLIFLKADLELEQEGIKSIEEELAKTKKWIQKAVTEKTKGDFGDWCKSHGHGGVSQACINAAAKAGGRASKMALFAVNVNKGKYYYPKNKKK
jgi:hypothetical protein